MDTEKITIERNLIEIEERLYKLMIKKKLSMNQYYDLDSRLMKAQLEIDYIKKIIEQYEDK